MYVETHIEMPWFCLIGFYVFSSFIGHGGHLDF